MKVTRRSPLTGETNTLELNITQDQYNRWNRGASIQTVAPHLSADEREFIITGLLPGEWDRFLGVEE